jgi:type IV secretory pathway VirB3-like protein
MNKKDNKTLGHLALALTRSPMFMGVNVRLFFANVVLCTLICIDAHTFWGIPVLNRISNAKFLTKE